jgi:nucleoside-diphosphate-sugar epimerase
MLRPGLVVGDGGAPFHSGLGLFNRDNHCIGWNAGKNPLPFVLVDDVADAIVRACHSPLALGKTYNVVGDVRLSAREYVAELSRALQRRIHFLPQPLWKSQAIEILKWGVKVGVQRRKVPFPSLRDLRSRGLVARFDTSGIKADLGWTPTSERSVFVREGVEVYRRRSAPAEHA